jgi:hypothetical protein
MPLNPIKASSLQMSLFLLKGITVFVLYFLLSLKLNLKIFLIIVMCVSVIPPRETGGSACGNWLRAALTRVAAVAITR